MSLLSGFTSALLTNTDFWQQPWRVKVTQSCLTLCDPWTIQSMEFSNTGLGSLSLLQWIFPTQESNWGLRHCRQILNQLSYQGSKHELCPSKKICSSWNLKMYMISKIKVGFLTMWPYSCSICL